MIARFNDMKGIFGLLPAALASFCLLAVSYADPSSTELATEAIGGQGVTDYIDPNASVDGDGTIDNPYNTEYWETITVGASGTPNAWVVVGAYGTGSKPKVTTSPDAVSFLEQSDHESGWEIGPFVHTGGK